MRGDRQYVREAVQGSLERSGVDCIDLYYQHRIDRTVPIEETWSEMKVLHSAFRFLLSPNPSVTPMAVCTLGGLCMNSPISVQTEGVPASNRKPELLLGV